MEPEGRVMQPSALRKGKFDAPRRVAVDLGIIHDLFGDNATLYHVLGVERWAGPADIRQAYLRQGRATLFESAHVREAFDDGAPAPTSLDDFPLIVRQKFQVLSIAYQVLSQTHLRADYDANGSVYVTEVTESSAGTRRSLNSVRWKPFIEEKIITDAHPDEHAHRHESRAFGESNIQEAEELETLGVGDTLDSFDGLSYGRIDSTQGLDESELHFVERLHKNKSLFHKEHQMTVQPITGDESAAALHSPCSVIFGHCTGETHDSILGCGLAETFYNLLGSEDAIPVVRAEHGGGRDDDGDDN